jgi:pimeloyl-ACP methyl ester carboxylesterase
MSAITTDGNLIHYEVLGRGRPVILVHSWIGSWRYWIPTMQSLQLKYRVYALDLFGFGDSAKNPQQYTLERQIALLDTFMQELGIPKAALVGHGLGAMIVTEFARRNPDRVPRVLIADAPLYDPGDLDHRKPLDRRLVARPAVSEAADVTSSATPSAAASAAAGAATSTNVTTSASAALRAAMRQAERSRGVLSHGVESVAPAPARPIVPSPNPDPRHNPLAVLIENHTPEALLARCFRRSEPNFEKLSVDVAKVDPAALRQSVEAFDSGRMLDTLRLLSAPVLVIHGGDDPLIPQPSEDILNYITLDKEHSVLPILLPNVRHFPMLEDDRFGRLVNEFLEAADMSKLAVKERWRRRTR